MISPTEINKSTLSSRSKTLYIDNINKIANALFKGNYAEMIQNPKQVYDYLKNKHKDSYASIGTYFTAICKLIDIHPEHPIPNKTKQIWKDYRNAMRSARLTQYNSNQLSNRELEKLVTSDEIKQQYCDMKNSHGTHMKQTNHLRFVLFAMFLNIRPKRADLGNVYISDDER